MPSLSNQGLLVSACDDLDNFYGVPSLLQSKSASAKVFFVVEYEMVEKKACCIDGGVDASVLAQPVIQNKY